MSAVLHLNKFKTAALSVAVSAFLASSAAAQSYAIEGPGRLKCTEFNKLERDAPQIREIASWITGYMTAHHRLMPDVFDLTAWQTPGVMLSLVGQFCNAKPQESVERATLEVVRYLTPNAMTEPSDTIAVRNGERMTLIYESVLGQVRDALTAAGFPQGPEDADFAKALEDYQKANDIPVSGLPDQRTLISLLGQ